MVAGALFELVEVGQRGGDGADDDGAGYDGTGYDGTGDDGAEDDGARDAGAGGDRAIEPEGLGPDDQHGLGTCAESEASVSVGRGWEDAERVATRNAG